MLSRLVFQLLTAASSFSSMGAKMNVLSQVSHGHVALEQSSAAATEGDREVSLFHLAF